MAKPYVIGIDMGGTNTAFGIVDATLRFTASWLLMMPKAKSMALALELLTAITSLA